ncbi:MAG: DUF6036 family nucleotidyltransferase [archaeon]
MISEFKIIEAQLIELNKYLKTKAEIYIIGGAVLLYHGLKPATKDIDIVVDSEAQFRALENAFKDAGYKTRIPGTEYKHMDLSQIFIKGDMRIDLFLHTVCSRFFLSENMKKRAIKVIDLNNIAVYLCSKEDIFLFKTMTDREGDVEDCTVLFQRGLDWDAILNELIYQAKETGNDVWITWVGERLETLVERGINFPKPFMDKVIAIVNNYYDSLEKTHTDKSV